ncbi:MAG: hypothetical protein K2X66_04580 [Cyanobacteria bacterium]|nr:hypothetical protein [Cyanobacteriota bacterium]
MFAPILLGFVGLAFGIDDIKHPVIYKDTCKIVGTGESVSQLKQHSKMIYRHSDQVLYDVGLQCEKMGAVMVNDSDPFNATLTPGSTMFLTSKSYQYLPTIWQVSVQSPVE